MSAAERHHLDALALADDMGARPLAASCRPGLGKLYARIGRHEDAEKCLSAARAVYRDMKMPAGLEAVVAAWGELVGARERAAARAWRATSCIRMPGSGRSVTYGVGLIR